ncbi:unnamed protein product [Bursaphelenchus okinawaensis]|uniref:Sodium/calcium exchanger membrane region domain-containing protein n=1 Tax=Bursaphelenchus okinawaensis TaxID=465554 RepID=A0A811JQY5_9BILA|nr:unnamed protein product [Bursaphelenchus okinawaensis]CAG9078953.1 unnamed protein product [Bursaphelenchus okinawaensis]
MTKIRRPARLLFVSYIILGAFFSYFKENVHGVVNQPKDLQTTTPHQHFSTCNKNKSHSQSDTDESQFPQDLFTLQERRNGAVLLHLLGLIYMFIALAIVCDEFFVPALGVITEKLDISEDVAGATFMAAGGSAPEFFTSVIGVFVAQNNVGIGTIVGSATFNILCVLAFCTLFSTTVLYLTWWPLFRDVAFYIVALLAVVLFFLDDQIVWWEALFLFVLYIGYCIFMKYNEYIETFVKVKVLKQKEGENDAEQCESIISGSRKSSMQPEYQPPNTRHYQQQSSLQRSDSLAAGRRRPSTMNSRRQSIPILHTGAMFRNSMMQIMSQKLESVDENENVGNGVENGGSRRYRSRKSSAACIKQIDGNAAVLARQNGLQNGNRRQSERRSTKAEIETLKEALEDEDEQPLDITWPETFQKRVVYVFLAPILYVLWLTIPDVRRPDRKNYYAVTFVFSILWIAAFSYIMVWVANTIGETFLIPTEVIGLTILAAGTSIPDLITSVIVARKGLGDMAVSSSVGSNIFDVCVGLPVPWLLYFIVNVIKTGSSGSVAVSSNGLVCSVSMLFFMLIFLVATIALCGWKMNKYFGAFMILEYCVFCTVSVLLELGLMQCPLRICV